MQWLIFSNRVVVICNICYVLTIIGRKVNLKILPDTVVSIILVLGFVSIFFNVLINFINGFAVLFKKKIYISLYLINFSFLLLQILNILYLEL